MTPLSSDVWCRWDTWGRLIASHTSSFPWAVIEGNHEEEVSCSAPCCGRPYAPITSALLNGGMPFDCAKALSAVKCPLGE